MSEEEIIEIIEELQCEYKEQENEKKYNDYTVSRAKRYSKGLQGLLDLYNKEKESDTKHLAEIGQLRTQLHAEKEKNKELFDEYKKRVATIIKYEQGIKTFIDDTNISDIEPWSEYKIKGELLFDLENVLEDE